MHIQPNSYNASDEYFVQYIAYNNSLPSNVTEAESILDLIEYSYTVGDYYTSVSEYEYSMEYPVGFTTDNAGDKPNTQLNFYFRNNTIIDEDTNGNRYFKNRRGGVDVYITIQAPTFMTATENTSVDKDETVINEVQTIQYTLSPQQSFEVTLDTSFDYLNSVINGFEFTSNVVVSFSYDDSTNKLILIEE